MGNLGFGLMKPRQSDLSRLRADILQACSEKDVDKLKSLLKEQGVVSLAEDVETLLLTQHTLLECLRDAGSQACLPGQDQASSQAHPGASPGFQCACLVLAVLLLRKLQKLKEIPPSSALTRLIWSCSPRFLFPELLNELLGDEDCMNTWLHWHRNALRGEHDKEVACFWIAAAVLQFDSLFDHQWTKPFLKNALFKSACAVLAIISGDQATLRRVFSSWGRYYFMKYATYFLPYWLTLAQNVGRNNMKTSMLVFEDYYRQAQPSLDDFLSSILRLICGDESENPKDSQRRADAKIDLVCTHASFFFDADCVSDDALQSMSERPWVTMANFMVLLNLESINENACRLCFAAFEKLCQRGCAGLFLMALQDEDALEAIPSAHRGRLILYLVEIEHSSQMRGQVLRNSCELCQHPIASFYLWMLSHVSLFDSCLDPTKVASYCSKNCMSLFRRMKRSGIRKICQMHEETKPKPSELACAILALEADNHKLYLGLNESKDSGDTLNTTESSSFEHDTSICGGHFINDTLKSIPELW